jgi:glycosyltransferase involved in cell wall biosynthesis
LEFSKKFESVSIICLEKGVYDLPNNVEVLSLGKEIGVSRFGYLFRFYSYIWNKRKSYDAVFVHMNPIYVVIGGLFWKLLSKPIFLWYTHKNVDLKLKIAEKLSTKIFSASKESFRLSSDKLQILGHGIDTDFFRPLSNKKDNNYNILSVSRISQTKNQLIMVEAIGLIIKDYPNLKFTIVGGPVTLDDNNYKDRIIERIKELKLDHCVELIGAISQKEVINFYQKSDLFINLSSTGSLDKAILEAMSSGLNILTSNEAFKNILPKECLVTNDIEKIADNLKLLINKKPDPALREYIVSNHNLGVLIDNLSVEIKKYEHIYFTKQ